MSESDEHRFLSQSVVDVTARFARTRLYSFRESDRRTFDFSCVMRESWDRLVDGQTLWRSRGADKDLRTLIVGSKAPLKILVARNTMSNHTTVLEAVRDYRSMSAAPIPRVFWIPSDFDADQEEQRAAVVAHMEQQILEDLVCNALLGRINHGALAKLFLNQRLANAGIELAILHYIATHGRTSNAELARGLDISTTSAVKRLQALQHTGFLVTERGGGQYPFASAAGRALLRICAGISRFTGGEEVCPEMRLVLEHLKITLPSPDTSGSAMQEWMRDPQHRLGRDLVFSTTSAQHRGADLSRLDFVPVSDEMDESLWT